MEQRASLSVGMMIQVHPAPAKDGAAIGQPVRDIFDLKRFVLELRRAQAY